LLRDLVKEKTKKTELFSLLEIHASLDRSQHRVRVAQVRIDLQRHHRRFSKLTLGKPSNSGSAASWTVSKK
jgi:hypothetical protein